MSLGWWLYSVLVFVFVPWSTGVLGCPLLFTAFVLFVFVSPVAVSVLVVLFTGQEKESLVHLQCMCRDMDDINEQHQKICHMVKDKNLLYVNPAPQCG